MNLIYIPLIVSVIDILFVLLWIRLLKKLSSGEAGLQKIADAIREGAKAFLKREFKAMIIVFLLVAIALGILNKSILPPIVLLIGAFISSLAGYIGMMVSTLANIRTTVSAQKSFPESFKTAIWGGQVMGFLVVGLGLLGVVILWMAFQNVDLLINYALGASLVALFMRVGGGIFTKSADVGADLVGKVEKGIPEDDPRNPAVIADQVGDNVGDIAGMGADLFESYVSTIIAAMVIGTAVFGAKGMIAPLFLAGIGIISSLLGTFFVRVSKDASQEEFSKQTESVRKAMERGVLVANVLMIVGSYFLIKSLFNSIGLFWAILFGLLAGWIIGKTSEYFSSEKKRPTLDIAEAGNSGASNVIIEGLIVGMKSTVVPVLAVSATIVLSYHFAGLYGIALASLGILGVLGINLSTDCYGPIADNAAGIAEMGGLGKEVRQRVEALDAVGNSTAAIGKGFAIGSAALAALAWLATYAQKINVVSINMLEPKLLAGLFIGAMLPFLFSALTMKGVSRGALEIVKEVRRQFRELPGLIEGTAKADYRTCVDLATKRAIREMIVPGILVVLTPILVGLILGKEAVAGTLVGALTSGFLVALFMANSGAAWDNAKKYIEAGNLGGKGSDAHKAAVVGDTVGDPFKDTAGPSLNILIKLISVVALISLALFS
ncbi:sodium-translocating pyrophosphatase [Patescibacteria group bacterium]|nr:sodium-translocating pyrophosphatase [Patescibacteria group bacterium]MBU4162381.1 sodium-translocating pyrophosphatase [Patescibacteria group bacterium]